MVAQLLVQSGFDEQHMLCLAHEGRLAQHDSVPQRLTAHRQL